MIQDTSLAAHESIKPEISERQAKVLKVISELGPVTNKQIARSLGWPINTVTPRTLELREAKLVEEAGKERDPDTGRHAITWQKAPPRIIVPAFPPPPPEPQVEETRQQILA
ncbi:MAG: hypothetical protein Q8L86_12450 [Vicinamibacterales bacterium]|nr:hypothetical protein [Vicinamibacterales bacterium]